MPKRLKLEPHQTPWELSKLYRQASDPIERTRYQIIWLLATGRVTEEVASVTGYCRNSIYRERSSLQSIRCQGVERQTSPTSRLSTFTFSCGTSTTVANFTNSSGGWRIMEQS
jgi:hypothetical protein